MNRLRASFAHFRAAGRPALLPYLTAGQPDLDATLAILRRLDPQRCACAELGIPFSDPLADGPVIQASFAAALARGFRVDDLLAALRRHRDAIAVPLVAMVSYSIVYRRDPQRWLAAARAAGLDGLIVPDLALEEAEELAALGRAHDCPLVLIVAPTTDPPRRARIAALSDPFVYYQSLAGVTGERDTLPRDLAAHVQELRAATGKPICVGFGIATPAHVRAVCQVADGAIVGSAIVRRLNAAAARGAGHAEVADEIAQLVAQLAAGTDPASPP